MIQEKPDTKARLSAARCSPNTSQRSGSKQEEQWFPSMSRPLTQGTMLSSCWTLLSPRIKSLGKYVEHTGWAVGGSHFQVSAQTILKDPISRAISQVLSNAFKQTLRKWSPLSVCSLVTIITSVLQSSSKIIKIDFHVKTEDRKGHYLLVACLSS